MDEVKVRLGWSEIKVVVGKESEVEMRVSSLRSAVFMDLMLRRPL
jgi:hypothetical protein